MIKLLLIFILTQLPLIQTQLSLRNQGLYDWKTFGFDGFRSSLYPYETTITSETASTLIRSWKLNVGGTIVTQPVVALDYPMSNDVVMSVGYFGDSNGKFYAININDGSIQWTRQFEFYNGPCGDLPKWGIIGAATFDRMIGTVYVMGGGSFYALSMNTGNTIWEIQNLVDFTALQNYGALLLVDDLIYITFASRCDFLTYYGSLQAISISKRKVVSRFYPSGNSTISGDKYWGGGIWGVAGATIGDPVLFQSSGEIKLPIYLATGNCLSKNENDYYCESIIKLDKDLIVESSFKPSLNTLSYDNDFGVSVTYFNTISKQQTSGCKIPLIAATRKDGTVFILNSITFELIQSLIMAPPNRAEYHYQLAWDQDSNILIVPTFTKYKPYNLTNGGIVAFQLQSNCQLDYLWKVPYYTYSSVSIAGPVGKRVVYAAGGFNFIALDLITGTVLANPRLDEFAAATPTIIDGTLLIPGWDSSIYGFQIQVPTSPPASKPSVRPMSLIPTSIPSRGQIPTNKPSSVPSFGSILKSTLVPTFSTQTVTIPTIQPSNTVVTTPTSSSMPLQELGCFGDGSVRAMSINLGMVNSIADCYQLAVTNKFTYIGMQYGGECWVSNDLIAATQYSRCPDCQTYGCSNPGCNCANIKCNSGENCGDRLAFRLLKIIYSSPTSTPSKAIVLNIESHQPVSVNSPSHITSLPTVNVFISQPVNSTSTSSSSKTSSITNTVIISLVVTIICIFIFLTIYLYCYKDKSKQKITYSWNLYNLKNKQNTSVGVVDLGHNEHNDINIFNDVERNFKTQQEELKEEKEEEEKVGSHHEIIEFWLNDNDNEYESDEDEESFNSNSNLNSNSQTQSHSDGFDSNSQTQSHSDGFDSNSQTQSHSDGFDSKSTLSVGLINDTTLNTHTTATTTAISNELNVSKFTDITSENFQIKLSRRNSKIISLSNASKSILAFIPDHGQPRKKIFSKFGIDSLSYEDNPYMMKESENVSSRLVNGIKDRESRPSIDKKALVTKTRNFGSHSMKGPAPIRSRGGAVSTKVSKK